MKTFTEIYNTRYSYLSPVPGFKINKKYSLTFGSGIGGEKCRQQLNRASQEQEVNLMPWAYIKASEKIHRD